MWSFFLFFSFSRTVLRALPLCLLVCRAELRAAPSCWGLGTLLLQTHRLQLETNSVSASFSSLQHDLRLLPLGRSKYSIHFFFFFLMVKSRKILFRFIVTTCTAKLALNF